MRVSNEEIKQMINEEKSKQEQKLFLEAKIVSLENELNKINENTMEAPASAPVKAEEKKSIYDAKPGEVVILNFENVTIKVKRQLDDLFKVEDAAESQKLKEGDYIKAKGNDILQVGRKFTFSILREIPYKYETNPLQGWRIIKN